MRHRTSEEGPSTEPGGVLSQRTPGEAGICLLPACPGAKYRRAQMRVLGQCAPH